MKSKEKHIDKRQNTQHLMGQTYGCIINFRIEHTCKAQSQRERENHNWALTLFFLHFDTLHEKHTSYNKLIQFNHQCNELSFMNTRRLEPSIIVGGEIASSRILLSFNSYLHF